MPFVFRYYKLCEASEKFSIKEYCFFEFHYTKLESKTSCKLNKSLSFLTLSFKVCCVEFVAVLS